MCSTNSKKGLHEESFNIIANPKHIRETFNFIVNFFASTPKIKYIYSNTSHFEFSPFHYDLLEINNNFIPVPVFAEILNLKLNYETDEIRTDPYERVMILCEELRAWNYKFNINELISKKQCLKTF